MGRAPCCDKANVKKGPWSPEEDATLKSYIHEQGTGGNWIALPQKIGLKRCGKSCRLRWLNYLRPNIKHGGFSVEEDNIICSLYLSIGSRWSIIAAQLPGRTDNDIKNYWNTRLKKKLMGKQKSKLEQQQQQARRGSLLLLQQAAEKKKSRSEYANSTDHNPITINMVSMMNNPLSYWPDDDDDVDMDEQRQQQPNNVDNGTNFQYPPLDVVSQLYHSSIFTSWNTTTTTTTTTTCSQIPNTNALQGYNNCPSIDDHDQQGDDDDDHDQLAFTTRKYVPITGPAQLVVQDSSTVNGSSTPSSTYLDQSSTTTAAAAAVANWGEGDDSMVLYRQEYYPSLVVSDYDDHLALLLQRRSGAGEILYCTFEDQMGYN